MIKAKFKGADWLQTVKDLLTLLFDDDKEYEITISEFKEKRSLKANNYSWVLTDKLAEKMLVAGARYSKDEMHAEMIFRYGQPETKDGHTVVLNVLKGVDVSEYYPYAKIVAEGEINGKEYTSWRVYRGSHTYNKQEMQIFIRGIVEECREQGIPTETPDEIAKMISLMEEVDA